MIPAAFDYEAPASLDEALSLLAEHGDDAKILAGGHSLLPLMKLRLAAPSVLIDIGRIDGLRQMRETGDGVMIGATATYSAVQDFAAVRQHVPLLAQAISMVGDTQVRNRGTLGGALAHADPAGDMPVVVTALGATMVVRGPGGERTIPADEFFVDIFSSALGPDEILTEIRIPAQAGPGNYQKFRRRAIDWAIVGAAVSVTRANGSIDAASVVLTNVGPRPMRAAAVESALTGQQASADVIRQAADRAADGITPTGELSASAEYKSHLACVLTRRALTEALGLG